MKKKVFIVFLAFIVFFIIVSVPLGDVIMNSSKEVFKAIVLDVYETGLLVSPIDTNVEKLNSDQIIINNPSKFNPDLPPLEINNIIEIEYNGEVLETYPLEIHKVYYISLIDENIQEDNTKIKSFEEILEIETLIGNELNGVNIEELIALWGEPTAELASESGYFWNINENKVLVIYFDQDSKIINKISIDEL